MTDESHRAITIDQFTRQAIPFAQLPGHSSSIDLLLKLTRATSTDRVLDVACGPGLVACQFAPHVAEVVGLDLTPEMIHQATQAQQSRGLTNMTWQVGQADQLPFADEAFSIVLTRYSFHHVRNPSQVLQEMERVCRHGGRVLIADVCMPEECVTAYDELELIRDPSHVHALSRAEFGELIRASRLKQVEFAEYQVDLELEAQLKASFPVAGGAERIRTMLHGDVGVNRYGVNARWVDGALHYSVPIAVAVGIR